MLFVAITETTVLDFEYRLEIPTKNDMNASLTKHLNFDQKPPD